MQSLKNSSDLKKLLWITNYTFCNKYQLTGILIRTLHHHHHHRPWTSIYHVSFDKTNMGFHASVAGTFCKTFFTFTKTERRCDSEGQSIILSACITAFWLVIEAKFYTRGTCFIFARLVEHREFMKYGEPVVKLNIRAKHYNQCN